MRRARARRIFCAAMLALGSLGWSPRDASTPIGDQVLSLDGVDGRAIYLLAGRAGCPRCLRLYRSYDGGRTLRVASARGMSGGTLVALAGDTRPVLVLLAGDRTQVSLDEGESFQTLGIVSAHVARIPDGGDGSLLLSGAVPHIVPLPSLAARPLRAAPLMDHRAYVTPAYHDAHGVPPIFAAGNDSNGRPTLASCDRRFRCEAPRAIFGAPSTARLHVSPGFARDGIVVATLIPQGVLVSLDHGRSFSAARIPTGPGDLVATVQAVALKPYGSAKVEAYLALVAAFNVEGRTGGIRSRVLHAPIGGSAWRDHAYPLPDHVAVTGMVASGRGDLVVSYSDPLRGGGGLLCSRESSPWVRCGAIRLGTGGDPGGPDPTARLPVGEGVAATPLPAPSGVAAQGRSSSSLRWIALLFLGGGGLIGFRRQVNKRKARILWKGSKEPRS